MRAPGVLRRRSACARLSRTAFIAAAYTWALTVNGALARAAGTGPQEEDLFRSGQSGYFCFRIPAMVVTAKGTVLAFAEARKTNCEDWDEIDLVLRRSEAGNNWSDIVVLFSEAKRSMNQPTPIVDRETGSIWLVFCRDNQSVFVSHSEDDGLTWSQPRDITDRVKDPTWKYVAAGPGHGIQLNNGRLLLAAWGDTSPGPVTWPPRWGEVEFTYTMFSDDHGATWQRGRPMYENATEEAMVFEAADHRVFITLRSLHDKFRRGHAWSADGGYSWSRIEFDENLPDPPAHASIIKVPGGGANRGLVLFANPASVKERTHLTVRMSEDDGRTWAVLKVLYSGSSAYSDLAIENDGGVLCLFEADRYSRLVLARFHVERLMKKNSPEKD